jgi:hypothetical protein
MGRERGKQGQKELYLYVLRSTRYSVRGGGVEWLGGLGRPQIRSIDALQRADPERCESAVEASPSLFMLLFMPILGAYHVAKASILTIEAGGVKPAGGCVKLTEDRRTGRIFH